MKNFLLILFCLSTGTIISKAQSFTISPNDTLIVTAPADQLSIFDIYQENTTAQPLSLSWESVTVDIPDGWDYSLCDLGTCYPGIPAGATMAEVEVGGSGFLGVNIQPYFVPGTALVQINVFETANPSVKYTLTWIIDANLTGVESVDVSEIEIFPTITSDVLNISLNNPEVSNIQILNSVGRVLATFPIAESLNHLNVSEFSAGVYYLVMLNEGDLVWTERFVKVD